MVVEIRSPHKLDSLASLLAFSVDRMKEDNLAALNQVYQGDICVMNHALQFTMLEMWIVPKNSFSKVTNITMPLVIDVLVRYTLF